MKRNVVEVRIWRFGIRPIPFSRIGETLTARLRQSGKLQIGIWPPVAP